MYLHQAVLRLGAARRLHLLASWEWCDRICGKLNRVQASGTTRKTVWDLGKEEDLSSLGTLAATAEVVVEEKLIGGVELLTV